MNVKKAYIINNTNIMYARIVTLLTKSYSLISFIYIYIIYFSTFSTYLPLSYSPCSFINRQLFEFDCTNSTYTYSIYVYYVHRI